MLRYISGYVMDDAITDQNYDILIPEITVVLQHDFQGRLVVLHKIAKFIYAFK